MATSRSSRGARGKSSVRTIPSATVQPPAPDPADSGGTDSALVHQLQARLQAVRAIGSIMAKSVGIAALFRQLVPHVSALMRAEYSVLYLYDAVQQEIWSQVGDSEHDCEVRMALGTGIAGWVAASRQAVNVPDAYADPRFNPAVDLRTGFRTKSMLVVPLISSQSDLMGVMQVLNHVSGAFSEEDLGLLQAIATEATYAVENAYLNEQLRSQTRWVSMGHMMANLAHDLRNPMTSLAFHAELMTRENDAGARRARHGQISRHLDEMSAMVTDVLAHARGDSRVQPVAVDLGTLAAEMEKDLRVLCAPHAMELRSQIKGGTVIIDVARTRRIIYNLVKNAAEALCAGGWVLLTLEATPLGLRLEVADNGPGIAPAMVHRIFEPFTANSGKPAGHGLGLSIVKRFVEDQGGHIAVSSNLGRGTTFFVTLPNLA